MKSDFFAVASGRAETLYDRAVARVTRNDIAERIMNRDASVFTRRKALQYDIAHRLGWVDVSERMRRRVATIETFGKDILRAGFKHVVLMGMGGSSLCPDLLGKAFGGHTRLASYDVIDSTAPKTVRAVCQAVDLKKTLFIVSSKSGSTVETRAHMTYFMGELERVGFSNPARQFVAITDEDSSLHDLARRERFRKIFVNPADIGGRYSALSYFGMVPAFFAGADLRALLADALAMEKLIRERQGETNPAIALGAMLASAAGAGIDKLTFVASKRTAPLVPWIEQLVAESTGKDGKGIIPVAGEALGDIGVYDRDRLFVSYQMASERAPLPVDLAVQLKKKGNPIVRIGLESENQFGGQFILWEAATAIAGYLLEINPFDEPNVTESKYNTAAILDRYRESGQFADMTPAATYGRLTLLSYGGPRRYQAAELVDLRKLLTKFFSGMKKPRYCAILNYLREDRAIDRSVATLREEIRARYRVATVTGYGPRYLHSSGQLHKGGPANGRFIIFVHADYGELDIPGRFFDFGQLITAQAIGDARALIGRKLPTLVIAVEGNAAKGLKEFTDVVHKILG